VGLKVLNMLRETQKLSTIVVFIIVEFSGNGSAIIEVLSELPLLVADWLF
jgi:hypothetical protein